MEDFLRPAVGGWFLGRVIPEASEGAVFARAISSSGGFMMSVPLSQLTKTVEGAALVKVE